MATGQRGDSASRLLAKLREERRVQAALIATEPGQSAAAGREAC
ncbi:hypothetical protein ACFWIQ_11370 [Kitasatospora sp. NPDC127059]